MPQDTHLEIQGTQKRAFASSLPVICGVWAWLLQGRAERFMQAGHIYATALICRHHYHHTRLAAAVPESLTQGAEELRNHRAV